MRIQRDQRIENCAVDKNRSRSKTVHVSDAKEIEKPIAGLAAGTPTAGNPVEKSGVSALTENPRVDEAKEKVLAAKASREMWTAIVIIVGSFVFVLVAAALVIIVGHIQLF
jgi:hypothetical protein